MKIAPYKTCNRTCPVTINFFKAEYFYVKCFNWSFMLKSNRAQLFLTTSDSEVTYY